LMLKAEIIIPLTDTAAFPAQRKARSPGRVHNPGCRMQQGHHWHLGDEVDEETAQKKLDFEYFQDMKVHFRLLRSVAKSLEPASPKQLKDLISFFARELGTEHTLVPDEKVTRAHKRARKWTSVSPCPRLYCASLSPAEALKFTILAPSALYNTKGSSACVVQSPTGFMFTFARAAAAPPAPPAPPAPA